MPKELFHPDSSSHYCMCSNIYPEFKKKCDCCGATSSEDNALWEKLWGQHAKDLEDHPLPEDNDDFPF